MSLFNAKYSEFTDTRDGQKYRAVKIGNQIWMAENLRYKIKDSWYYDDNESNSATYGLLYNWQSARKAPPPGWHLPTRQEWNDLVEYAGGKDFAGKKLKASSGWRENGGDNALGFSALPGGIRYAGVIYGDIGSDGYWWEAAEIDGAIAYYQYMHHCFDYVNEDHGDKRVGRSVRCVKN